MVSNRNFLPSLLLAALSLIWGSSFILIKKGLLVFSPYEVALIRVVSAFFFLLPFAVMRLHKLRIRDHLKVIASGVMGIFIPSFLFAIAETRLDSSIAGIMNSFTPMWAVLIGIWIGVQRLTKYTIAGIVIGFIGGVLLMRPSLQHIVEISGVHALMLVGATFLYGCNLSFLKYKLKHINPLTITSVSLFILGVFSTIYLFGFTEFTTKLITHKKVWQSLAAVVTLGLMSTAVGIIVLNYLIKITTPLYASLVTYLIPLVAVALGVLDGEQLDSKAYLGMVAIIVGVSLINKRVSTRAS